MKKAIQNGVIYLDYENGVVCSTGKFGKEVKLLRADTAILASIVNSLTQEVIQESVSIRITGETSLGEALEPYEGICEDGTIELDGYETGDKLMIETLNQNVENASLEVVV